MCDDMSAQKEMIGTGMRFPLLPDELHNLQQTDDIERINQSLFILFETPMGTRIMLPDYGTNLKNYRFEPNDDILVESLKQELYTAIMKWEPRITAKDIEFYRDSDDIDNNILYIHLTYGIGNSSDTYNFVYPFKEEPYDSVENDIVG